MRPHVRVFRFLLSSELRRNPSQGNVHVDASVSPHRDSWCGALRQHGFKINCLAPVVLDGSCVLFPHS